MRLVLPKAPSCSETAPPPQWLWGGPGLHRLRLWAMTGALKSRTGDAFLFLVCCFIDWIDFGYTGSLLRPAFCLLWAGRRGALSVATWLLTGGFL